MVANWLSRMHNTGMTDPSSQKWPCYQTKGKWLWVVVQLYLTLHDPMDCSTPDFPVHHQVPECAQTHVHWGGDTIQPPHPGVPFSTFNLSQWHNIQTPDTWQYLITTSSCGATGVCFLFILFWFLWRVSQIQYPSGGGVRCAILKEDILRLCKVTVRTPNEKQEWCYGQAPGLWA